MFDENKEIVHKLYSECWNQGKMDSLPDLVSSGCRLHDPVFPALIAGPENLRRHIQMCRTAFPDLHYTIDHTIAERDEVVVHWTARGTHKNQFLGMLPTYRRTEFSGTSIYLLRDKKIVEQWAEWNLLTMLEQLHVAIEPKIMTAASR